MRISAFQLSVYTFVEARLRIEAGPGAVTFDHGSDSNIQGDGRCVAAGGIVTEEGTPAWVPASEKQ